MSSLSYGDLQSKTYGDSTNLTYAFEDTSSGSNTEYSRRIDYWTSSETDSFTGLPLVNGTVVYPTTVCGNIRLFIRNDAHLRTYARTDGHDIHFVTENGTELPFELVYYGNGTGEWWIKVAYTSTASYSTFYMKYGYDGAWFDKSSMIWCKDLVAYSDPTELPANYTPSVYKVVQHASYHYGTSPTGLIGQVSYLSGHSPTRHYNSVKFYGDSHYEGYTFFTGGNSWETTYPTYSALGNPCDYATFFDANDVFANEENPFEDDTDGTGSEGIMFGIALKEGSTGRTGYAHILSFRGITVAYNESTGINFYCGSNSSPWGFGISANPPQGCLIRIEVGRLREVQNSNPTEYTQAYRISYRTSVDYGSVLYEGYITTTNGSFLTHSLSYTDAPPTPQILERYRLTTGIGDNEELNGYNTNVSYITNADGYYAMLFHNEAIRTIGEPTGNVTPTPTPSATSSFIWTRLKTYQGLAGGCN